MHDGGPGLCADVVQCAFCQVKCPAGDIDTDLGGSQSHPYRGERQVHQVLAQVHAASLGSAARPPRYRIHRKLAGTWQTIWKELGGHCEYGSARDDSD